MGGYALFSIAFRVYHSGYSLIAPRTAILIGVLCLAPHAAFSQEAQEDTLRPGAWQSDLQGKLIASQAGYQNWTEGGVNSLASAASITGKFVKEGIRWNQTYETRLALGVVKQDTLDFRKAEDVIRLDGAMSFNGDGFFRKFNPTAALNVRTQFAPGFNYEKNPFGDDRAPPVKVSDFLSPAVLTQSLGLTYSTEWGFKQRVGAAAKETIILIPRLREIYGQGDDESVRFQVGLESLTDIDREIFRNVRLKSGLRLFAAFNQEELPDMLWENLIVMRVNEWLSADFEFVTLFDRDVSKDIQMKEALSLGISVVFL